MVITTREEIMVALLAKLSAAGEFVTVGRRNRSPETIGAAETPALMLVQHSESYRVQSTLQPPIRRMLVKAIIYSDVGTDQTAVPSTLINNILDAIDAMLVPDNPMTGMCTLSGLVRSIAIDGVVAEAPGDVTGKSLAIIPLNILLP